MPIAFVKTLLPDSGTEGRSSAGANGPYHFRFQIADFGLIENQKTKIENRLRIMAPCVFGLGAV